MYRMVFKTQKQFLGTLAGCLVSLLSPWVRAEPPPPEAPAPAAPPTAEKSAEKPVEPPALKTVEEGAPSGNGKTQQAAPPGSRREQGARLRRPANRVTRRHAADRRMIFGGLGYASVAPFFGTIDAFESALAQPGALGPSYGPSPAGLMVGGGGGGVFFGHLWLGGKGYAFFAPTPDTPQGKTSFGGGGGGVELGYVVQPGMGSLLIPYFGVQGFGSGVGVTNNTSSPLPIQTGIEIPAGTTRTFSAGFIMLEAAIRFQRLVFFGGNGGLTAGFELGVLGSFGKSPWMDDTSKTELHELPSAGLSGMFVRLNIGGGSGTFR